MKRPQLLALALALVAAAALYLIPSRVPPAETRFDVLADSLAVTLPAPEADRFRALSREAQGGDAAAHRDLAALATEAGVAALAAEHLRRAADAEPAAEAYAEAGDRFHALIGTAETDEERVDYVFRALYSYEKLLELDSADLDRKVRLATLYTDHQGNVMQGVMMLREVAAADSTNAEAQMRLGRFSLMSGQVDKAVERFRTVLRQDSLNLPARFLLAQTLANAGREDVAGGVLREGLALAPDSASRAEIQRLLDDLDQRSEAGIR